MAGLVARFMPWILISVVSIAGITAVYTGAINKGIQLRDDLWRTHVLKKKTADGRANASVESKQRSEDAELDAEIKRIKAKWAAPAPSQ